MPIVLRVYRHKHYKDVYLAKDVGNKSGCSFYPTKRIYDALHAADDSFYEYLHNIEQNYEVKFKDSKRLEADGYAGVVTRTTTLKIKDFEPVYLMEYNI